MKNRWSDRDAKSCVDEYISRTVNEDLALRVYSSRLLGSEPELVLHGGGNTSVKTRIFDIVGKETEVLCVKGSGYDLKVIEPAGFPAVRLRPIREVFTLESMTDEELINVQRTNLFDASAPNPSVETLLHAFLPYKFVDHTHANAVLTLTDQKNGAQICRDVFGDTLGLVPYVMPGFALAKKAQEVFEQNKAVEGLLVLKHGIFTFGENAKESYDRMINLVTKAELEIIKRQNKRNSFPKKTPKSLISVSKLAPILRGMLALEQGGVKQSFVMDFRTSAKIRNFLESKELRVYGKKGTITPDHIIRTKAFPMVVPTPEKGKLEKFRKGCKKALDKYVYEYHAYFERNNGYRKGVKTELDPFPRVILIPSVGLFGLGEDAFAASVASDLAETNIKVISDVEAMGTFEGISEADIFDVEYWALEQAKLGPPSQKPLNQKIVAITGGGSGIGAATARVFSDAGAIVVVLDLNETSAPMVAEEINGFSLICDVTKVKSVAGAFGKICKKFGGLDILVSNAGAAWQGRIGEVDDTLLRQSFDLNFFAHQSVAQAAVRIFLDQKIGGCLLFNASKQAVNPGRNFGPYGLPKAATMFLMRQYALDYGEEGIRSNAINADRIRTGILNNDLITSRAKARGISKKEYMSGNLLRCEVKAEDVAKGFLHLALAEKTTGAVLTVDGGNIPAALR